MTWQTGTTDNYLTALQDLIDVATSSHVATAAINAAGTGYVAGEILTVAGGTSTHTATIEVLTVGGSGEVTSIRKRNGGAYTVNPTLTANAVTGGSGSGCTIDLTMNGTGWNVARREYRAARATISAGGTGHAVNDKLTVSGGTSTEAAVFNVDQVSGGAVVAVSIDTPGRYTVTPSNPVSTTSDGSGTGCTLTVEYEQEVIMQGDGAGSDDITVALKTYQTLDTTGFKTCFNWGLFAMSEYNAGLLFFQQPNLSPGFGTTPSADPDFTPIGGARVPLRDTDGTYPITYWFNINSYRIICVFKVEGATTTEYSSMHLGYLNRFGTTTDLAFPMYVAGCSHRENVHFEDVTPYITGLIMMDGNEFNGPGYVYEPSQGTWRSITNSDVSESGTSRSQTTDSAVYPGGNPNLTPDDAAIVTTGWGEFNDAIPDVGVPGSALFQIYPSEDSGGDIYWLIPAAVMLCDNADDFYIPYGEIDDIFWTGRAGTLTAEDTFTINGELYRIFQSGNRTEEFAYFVVKESY